HGREINGIAAIERVFESLDPGDVCGDVVFFPVMNPLAVRMQQQDFPTEENRYRPVSFTRTCNMNRTWPDQKRQIECYAAAITSIVWETYVRHADVLLDLHGWGGRSLSLAWAHERDLELLRSFGFPWYMVRRDPSKATGVSETTAWSAGIPVIVTELAPQNAVHNPTVKLAVRSIGNLLKFKGLLKGEPDLPPVQVEFDQDHEETALVSEAEGLLVSEREPGDWVREGQGIARVISLETLETLWSFEAPYDGLVYNLGAGLGWGEDHLESAVVFPGQTVGLLKKPSRVFRNRQESEDSE
ncbi:MAG: succinylglutamate desuccinylase/aspartoacylase family protein, partial [Candidatus Pacebacteria bacterium]|nr:succinylglutamate desuccinylase/aspartoacylase family protein [Candidatus Paceibacterota bacterium]